MTEVPRRRFLVGAATVLAASAAGRRRAPAAASERAPGRIQWEDLGQRSEDVSGRAWFGVARRPADGTHWVYSGTTNKTNHLLRFDAPAERWVIAKRGNAQRPWFPDPGAEFPAGVDNGFTVWDAVNDELWVSCVNPYGPPPAGWEGPWRGFSPAVYGVKKDAWRAVTAAEFPTFDFDVLPRAFNQGAAAGPEASVIYGLQSTLWVYEGASRKWHRHQGHGQGAGKPGTLKNIQNQLQWVPSLHAFLLYAQQHVYTLAPGAEWKWTERPTSGPSPIDGRALNMVVLPGDGRVAVLGGRSPDVWVLDVAKWSWTRFEAAEPHPAVPRWDGAALVERDHLYACWGWGTPPAQSRRLIRLPVGALAG